MSSLKTNWIVFFKLVGNFNYLNRKIIVNDYKKIKFYIVEKVKIGTKIINKK